MFFICPGLHRTACRYLTATPHLIPTARAGCGNPSQQSVMESHLSRPGTKLTLSEASCFKEAMENKEDTYGSERGGFLSEDEIIWRGRLASDTNTHAHMQWKNHSKKNRFWGSHVGCYLKGQWICPSLGLRASFSVFFRRVISTTWFQCGDQG